MSTHQRVSILLFAFVFFLLSAFITQSVFVQTARAQAEGSAHAYLPFAIRGTGNLPPQTACGTLEEAVTWSYPGGYRLICPVVVPPGGSLTILPGVRVLVDSASDLTASLQVYGSLQVQGTTTSPVVFTSYRPNPAPGDWDSIHFYDGSTGVLDQALIEYGGLFTYAPLQVDGGSVTVRNSVIRSSSVQGIISKVWMTLENNQFYDNAREAYLLSLPKGGSSSAIIRGNTGSGNGTNALFIQGEAPPNAVFGENPGLPYRLEGSLIVPANQTLTVEAGARFELGVANQLSGLVDVSGVLNAGGTASRPVVFTSFKESTGAAQPGDWWRIALQPGSTANLDHTQVRYGGAANGNIYVDRARLILNHAQVRYSATMGIWMEESNSIDIRNSLIADNAQYGLRILCNAAALEPTLLNNEFSRNGSYGVYLVFNAGGIGGGRIAGNSGAGNGEVNGIFMEGNFTGQDSTLEENAGFPYVVWTITVTQSSRLELFPGAIIKPVAPPDDPAFFARGTGVVINHGTLTGVGTAQKPVVFTSFWDDSSGGDTNTDGNASVAKRGDWHGLIIGPGAATQFDYTAFRYGGDSDVMIWVNGGSFTLDHGEIAYSSQNGISGTGMISVTNSQVAHNTGRGVQLNGPGSLHWNAIFDNGEYGVVNLYDPNAGYRAPVENNYWGSANGPGYDGAPCPYGVPQGNGDIVNCTVTWYPYLTSAP